MTIDPNAGTEPVLERCEASATRSGVGELVLHLAGAWTLQNRIPALNELRESIEPAAGTSRISFDSKNLTGWDSGFLTFLLRINEYGKQGSIASTWRASTKARTGCSISRPPCPSAPEPGARPTCFPVELGNGNKFLAAATDNARSVPNEARMPPPEKGRPSDYTEWIFLGRLDAMIQRVQ